MTGRDLIKWIRENHAEEEEIKVCGIGPEARSIVWAWESEGGEKSDRGEIMLDTNAPEPREKEEE